MPNKKKTKTKQLLLVDDDPNMQRMVALFLKKNNYDLDIAANGRMALKNLEDSDYDLIITDMQMPLMTGIELLVKVRDMGIKTPVILISAYNSKEFPNEMNADEFDGILFKPFDSAELIQTINEVLKMHR